MRFYDNVGLPGEDGEADAAQRPATVTSPPTMTRSPSTGKLLLDLREVNIEDAPASQQPPPGLTSVAVPPRAADEVAASAASTPRAAPCIALPRQNAELLRHFAIGACCGTRAPRRSLAKTQRLTRSLAPRRYRRLADQARLLLL